MPVEFGLVSPAGPVGDRRHGLGEGGPDGVFHMVRVRQGCGGGMPSGLSGRHASQGVAPLASSARARSAVMG